MNSVERGEASILDELGSGRIYQPSMEVRPIYEKNRIGTQRQRFEKARSGERNPYLTSSSPRLRAQRPSTSAQNSKQHLDPNTTLSTISAVIDVPGRNDSHHEGQINASSLRGSQIITNEQWNQRMNYNNYYASGEGTVLSPCQSNGNFDSGKPSAQVNDKIIDVIHSHI